MADMGQFKAKFGAIWAEFGHMIPFDQIWPTSAEFRPIWAQFGPNVTIVGVNVDRISPPETGESYNSTWPTLQTSDSHAVSAVRRIADMD